MPVTLEEAWQMILGLRADLIEANTDRTRLNAIIRHAKDISPVVRPSLKRVMALVKEACMDLVRAPGGWLLKMGQLRRRFRKLSEIWELLNQDDWSLSEIFTEPAPKQRNRSTPAPRLMPRNPCIAPAATPVLAIPFCDSD